MSAVTGAMTVNGGRLARADAGTATPAGFGLSVTIVAALATLFMLEATRVFLSYLVFVVDQANRTELGLVAFGVFAAIALGGVLGRFAGLRLAASICLLGLVSARLVLQFGENPHLRLVCGAITVVAWGWLLPNLRALSPDDTARGVVYGLLLDLVVRYGFGTVDLPWMPNVLRGFVTCGLATLLLCFWPRLLAGKRPPVAGGAGPALLGIGPGLMFFQLLTGNLGMLEARSSIAVQFAVLLSAAGLMAGFAVQIRPPEGRGSRAMPSSLAIGATLTVFAELALLVFWRWDGVADLFLIGVAGIGAQLLVLAIRGGRLVGEQPSLIADGLWLTLGMLIQAVLVFTYYAATGKPILLFVALALLGLGAALAGRRGHELPALSSGTFLPWLTATAGIVLLAAFLVNRTAWSEVKRDETLPATVTAITYNIQTGFSRDNHWDLEATARVIEAQGSDIVILEEVSRGWTITSGVDEARWLSHRLKMNLAWGPSSNDGLWGVAILSRGTIITARMHPYSSTENLRRGLLGAAVATEQGPLYVYATHLDNPNDAGAIRLAQTAELVTLTANQNPAIVGGDFNATPESDVVAAMLAAGYADAGASLPPGTGTSQGGSRIDYLFVRGGVTVNSVDVPDVWASDHRPCVANVTISGAGG